jgi:hypothetical protein
MRLLAWAANKVSSSWQLMATLAELGAKMI